MHPRGHPRGRRGGNRVTEATAISRLHCVPVPPRRAGPGAPRSRRLGTRLKEVGGLFVFFCYSQQVIQKKHLFLKI